MGRSTTGMPRCSVSTTESCWAHSATPRPSRRPSKPTGSSAAPLPRAPKKRSAEPYPDRMAFQKAPFDVVEASRRVWLERWDPEAASGMAVYTAVLRSYQLLNDQVNGVMRRHDLTFARYEVL